ncbi:hypothetical protein [Actinocatenispora sera]|uniref:hypothetical protein n=1 Tax=Actinocatenispora sera TaxID=390989 RepID=UPI0004C4236D|nr:hypothetical protein [Actinocatenispora sera]
MRCRSGAKPAVLLAARRGAPAPPPVRRRRRCRGTRRRPPRHRPLTGTREHDHPAPGTYASVEPSAHRSTGGSAADSLPLAATQLPRTIDTDPAHAEPLSTRPVRHALGLFAAYPAGWPQVPPRTSVVLVLGDDARMRRIATVAVLGSAGTGTSRRRSRPAR